MKWIDQVLEIALDQSSVDYKVMMDETPFLVNLAQNSGLSQEFPDQWSLDGWK